MILSKLKFHYSFSKQISAYSEKLTRVGSSRILYPILEILSRGARAPKSELKRAGVKTRFVVVFHL